MNTKFDAERNCSLSLGLVDAEEKIYHIFICDEDGNHISIFADEPNLDKLKFLLCLKDDLIKEEDEVSMEKGSEEVIREHARPSRGE
jgi:DNA primase